MKWMIYAIAVLMVLLLVYSSVYTLDFNEIAIVKTFGKAAVPILGSTDAGLHLKAPWPIQELIRYDARIFMFEDTYEQLQTQDKSNVLITLFCAWRIKDADRFLRRIKTVPEGQRALRDLVRSSKAKVVGRHSLGELLNTDPERMRIPQIEQEMLQAVRLRAKPDYGIEVVSVGIRSFGLPQSATEKVIAGMVTERKGFADEYRSRGMAYADLIRNRAETAAEIISAFAMRKAKAIETEGDRAAGEYYKVFKKHEDFAVFLRELESLTEIFKENTIFVGSAEVERSMGFFVDGPSLPGAKPKPKTPK